MYGATGRLFYYLCCSCVFVVRLCIPTVSFLKYEVNVGRCTEAWQMEKGLWTCQEVTVFRSLFHEVFTITRDNFLQVTSKSDNCVFKKEL